MECIGLLSVLVRHGYSRENSFHIIEVLEDNVFNLKQLSGEIAAIREIMLWAVGVDGRSLKYAAHNFKNDREIVLKAVKNAGNALEFVGEHLCADREIILAALEQNGYALHYVNEELKGDRDIIYAAIKCNGLVLKYANEKFRDDKEIALIAATMTRGFGTCPLEYMSERLKNDKEVVFISLLSAKENDYPIEDVLANVSDELRDVIGRENPLEVLRSIIENESLSNAIISANTQKKRLKV